MFVNTSFIFSLLCEAAVLYELLIPTEFELLKVMTSKTHQSPIFEARQGAAIVRSMIDSPALRLNVKSLPWLNTIGSFLANIAPTRIPLLSRRSSPQSGD